MAGDREQRTEKPTPKRQKESKRKGQVARSQTLVPWATLLVATTLLPRLLSVTGSRLGSALREVQSIAAQPDTAGLARVGFSAAGEALAGLLPLFVLVVVLAIGGSLAQTGLAVTLQPLAPKWQRISPAAGVKRLLSTRNLWETARQVVLLGIILLLAVPSVVGTAEQLAGSTWPLSASLATAGAAVLSLIQIVAAIGVGAGLVDYAWQRWNLARERRMTKQEVRQEHRESDGDPMVKAKLRSLRAALSRNRMMAAVADADVIVTNPTHVAVALRYEPIKGAPRVLASGTGTTAARIRRRAAETRVPLVSAPPLARALHRSCRPGDEIPRELFQAVATVLAFVHRVGRSSFPASAVSVPVLDTWTPPGAEPGSSPTRRSRPAVRRRGGTPVGRLSTGSLRPMEGLTARGEDGRRNRRAGTPTPRGRT